MHRLAAEGIRGADLVFACIGPALELFSRYPRVELPDGEVVGLGANPEARGEPARRGYLSYVWEAVGKAALAQVLEAGDGSVGMLEEDARLTALFLWTVQATELTENGSVPTAEDPDDDAADDDEDEVAVRGKKKGLVLIYDVVRRFAQPLGIHLDQWEGRIVETEKGVVRLLPVRERAAQLFGEDGAAAVAERLETARSERGLGQTAFEFRELASPAVTPAKGRRKGRRAAAEDAAEMRRDATTLDRVHAAMLFQASGASNALRALLETEIGRGPEFLRLATALPAL
jgi:hypothetical protein